MTSILSLFFEDPLDQSSSYRSFRCHEVVLSWLTDAEISRNNHTSEAFRFSPTGIHLDGL